MSLEPQFNGAAPLGSGHVCSSSGSKALVAGFVLVSGPLSGITGGTLPSCTVAPALGGSLPSQKPPRC